MDNSTCSSEQEDVDRCRWFRINWKWCKMGSSSLGINIHLNPMVSLVSALIIWGFVAWCIIKPETTNSTMAEWKTWITATFIWMYIGTQDAWAANTATWNWENQMKNLNSKTRPTSPCCLPLGMFTPVISVVSTVPAIIPHSNYFCKRRFK